MNEMKSEISIHCDAVRDFELGSYKIKRIMTRLSTIFILTVYIASCNRPTDEIRHEQVVNKEDSSNINFRKFDSLFTNLKLDSVSIRSDEFPFPKQILGNFIDTSLFNKYVYPTLNKNFDNNYGAIFKRKINDSITIYFIRHGFNTISEISLIPYNFNKKQFQNPILVSNYVGDEGIEMILKSTIYFSDSIEVNSRYLELFNSKIEFDSTYRTIIKL